MITITVHNVNESPSAIDDFFVMDNPDSLVITQSELLANDSDPESGTLVLTLLNPPDNGTLIINPDNSFTYQPNTGSAGVDFFVYEISDGVNAPERARVFITPVSTLPPPSTPPLPPPPSPAPPDVQESAQDPVSESADAPISERDNPSNSSAPTVVPVSTVVDTSRPLDRAVDTEELLSLFESREDKESQYFTFRPTPERVSKIAKPLIVESLVPEEKWESKQEFPEEWYSNYVTTDYLGALDGIHDEVKSEDIYYTGIVGSTIAVTGSLSVGYVIWMIRGGVLMSSILSSLPAWKMIDPLPILAEDSENNSEDDESLESMVNRSNQGRTEFAPALTS